MGKGSKRNRKSVVKPATKAATRDKNVFREEDIDDEIDAFHKQRDVIPLDDTNEADDSDDDMEHPVFDFEGVDHDDSDNSKSSNDGGDDDDDADDDGVNDEMQPKGFVAKMARQAKYLQQKFGRVDDEIDDADDDEDEQEEKKSVWGRRKNLYYSADNVDYELQSSDEDLPMEEEAEVLKIQREKAKSLSMEDFGLEEADPFVGHSDAENKTFHDVFSGKRAVPECSMAVAIEDNAFHSHEEIKKDLSALSSEEQMEVVYSSAPELVGLLTELNETLNQLKQLKPLLSEVMKERREIDKGGMNYLEVKQILLLSYCQAIGFYLLLKSEGHSVRDHPVIARLVQIKNLLEKMKQIDVNLPSQIEEIVNKKSDIGNILVVESVPSDVEPEMIDASEKQHKTAAVNETGNLVLVSPQKELVSENADKEEQVGFRSMEMLKVRANLEAKLKKKGIYSFPNAKPEKTQNISLKPVNQRLETYDDFGDEVQQPAKPDGRTRSLHLNKASQLVANKAKKQKFASGDDDLPKRDDVGERRRKYELRVLARAGATSEGDDVDDDTGDDGAKKTGPMDVDAQEEESEDEFYKQVKKQRAGKLKAKEQLYSRTPLAPSMPLEIEADGKRHISYQMEKNRGLTRARKKLLKNPRKKYKIKHQKAVIRRKGQVRDIRKPTGPYGGEASGVNINVSRSIRLKG